MKIYGIHSSTSENCGISIFNSHLGETFHEIGIHFETLNINENINSVYDGIYAILHYIPSSYSTKRSSENLIALLKTINFKQLTVIFHGVYLEKEKRYDKDTLCPFQKEHLEMIFKKSSEILALSKSVELNLKTWLSKFNIVKVIRTLDHPGLFIAKPSIKINSPYIFIGGISRPKKNCMNDSTIKLINKCEEMGIRIWMHWTNMSDFDYNEIYLNKVWKTTYGLLTDQTWCNIISNAKIILCPYETQIQSVSGLIAEALSAQRFVITTNFDFAVEMRNRFPSLLIVNNDLEQWPLLIEKLFIKKIDSHFIFYKWNEFANDLLSVLVKSPEMIMV